ncbi:MAG: PadR family transcriptional regulator [Candidatus Bathyarchaeia archaeon]
MFETIHTEKNKLFWSLHKRTIKNFMDILILAELGKAPLSGYDVIISIYRKFSFLPSSGTVYSLLYALERKGLIRGGWNERKRIYVLTPKGEEIIETALTIQGKIENLITKIFSMDLLDFPKREEKYISFQH